MFIKGEKDTNKNDERRTLLLKEDFCSMVHFVALLLPVVVIIVDDTAFDARSIAVTVALRVTDTAFFLESRCQHGGHGHR